MLLNSSDDLNLVFPGVMKWRNACEFDIQSYPTELNCPSLARFFKALMMSDKNFLTLLSVLLLGVILLITTCHKA